MHFFYPYTSSSKVVQSFGTLSPYFCAINKNLTVMVLGNRINVTQRAGADGWDRVEVKSGDRSIACSYQIKQQITIKLGAPYNDTITIETSEPISDKSDIAQFAKDMLYTYEVTVDGEMTVKYSVMSYDGERSNTPGGAGTGEGN